METQLKNVSVTFAAKWLVVVWRIKICRIWILRSVGASVDIVRWDVSFPGKREPALIGVCA